MRDIELYRQILGLPEPWSVANVTLDLEGNRVEVLVNGEQMEAKQEAVLTEARWMLEELRVTLYAQTLGTSRKVSIQRISKLVSRIV